MTCNCGSPNCNGGCGQCNPAGHLVPQPFYKDAKVCKQDHTQNIIVNQYALGLEVASSWNIPGCGASASLSVPGTTSAPIGAFIWNRAFGYFEIVGFDANTQIISVQNPCIANNLAPGSQVPSCTIFTISPPPCCADIDQTGVFLKYDFTAPADGQCTDITLTSEIGLSTNNQVEIGSGIYNLSAIKANNVVTICNDGNGITPGTPVIAQNAAGQYQYPIGIIFTNPCTLDPVTLGTVIICDGSGQSKLTGASVGSPLVLSNLDGTAAYDDTFLPDIDANIQNGTSLWGGISTGSANAQVIAPSPLPPAYVPGITIRFQAGFTNTGAMTIQWGALGVINVQNADGSMNPGDILAGGVYVITYVAAGVFRLGNTQPYPNDTWVPTYTPLGGGTFGGTTTYIASYFVSGKKCEIILSVTGTIGGTVNAIRINAPLTAANPMVTSAMRFLIDTEVDLVGEAFFFDANTIEVSAQLSNLTAGVNSLYINFSYLLP